MPNNYKYPEVTNEIHSYLLMGNTGGYQLCGDGGYAPILVEDGGLLLCVEFDAYCIPVMEFYWNNYINN